MGITLWVVVWFFFLGKNRAVTNRLNQECLWFYFWDFLVVWGFFVI